MVDKIMISNNTVTNDEIVNEIKCALAQSISKIILQKQKTKIIVIIQITTMYTVLKHLMH